MPEERRDTFNFRLLNVKDPFYDYIEKEVINKSDAIRNFIENGLSGKGGLSLNEKEELKNELVQINRSMRGIGINLNQIARNYHQTNNVNINELVNVQKVLVDKQDDLADLLNKLLLKI